MQSQHRQIALWAERLSRGDCPFAKPALRSGKVKIHYFVRNLLGTILRLARRVLAGGEIVLLVFDPRKLTPSGIADAVDAANILLRHDNRMVLYTHPRARHHKSHATLGVIFIQFTSEMVEAAARLKATGYYAGRSYPEWAAPIPAAAVYN